MTTHRTAYAIFWRAAAVAGLSAVTAGPAWAEEPPLHATLTCDAAPAPGRVKCAIEARADGGRTLAWADVVVLELPDFATALKGRIADLDATAHDETSITWAFALVAHKAGKGQARVRVRAVTCQGGRCSPHTLDVAAPLVVGH